MTQAPPGSSATARGPKPRLPQEEKSAATRERLLVATVECLVERGYARTTTTEVAERAGLSRGAMLHHFPSKAALVEATVEHLAHARIAGFVKAVTTLPKGLPMIDAVIELLWEQFTSTSFDAMLELGVAARTDPELDAVLEPLIRRYDDLIARTARGLFAHLSPTPEDFEVHRRQVYYLLHGLALKRRPGVNDDDIEAVLSALKQQLRGLAAPPRRMEGGECP